MDEGKPNEAASPQPPAHALHKQDSIKLTDTNSSSYHESRGRRQRFWHALHRLALAQLCFGILMQLSYVSFPAYNFCLGLWGLLVCTPSWYSQNTRMILLYVAALVLSIITDIIWASFWVSGSIFYDQLCVPNSVSITSCGGASDQFPGCQTNRFALAMLILNEFAKAATGICIVKMRTGSSRRGATRSAGLRATPNVQPVGGGFDDVGAILDASDDVTSK